MESDEVVRGVRRRTVWPVVGLLLTALAAPARGAGFVVTTTADSGAGSLRDAIASANGSAGADEITFDLAGCPCTIALASPLAVHEDLTITGPGAANLALDGGNAVQVLQTDNVPVAISDLTVRNGKTAASGGGIQANGPLTLTRVTIRDNTAGQYGGGVIALASATIVDSTFDANTATAYDGGGLYASAALTVSGSLFVGNATSTTKGYGGGGGLIAFGQTTISSTAFRNNVSSDWGGGAYIAYFANTTPSHLTDVQLTGNTAQGGGGGGAFLWFDTMLDGVEATDNYASYRGGGVYGGYAGSYQILVNDGRFLRNSATGGGGIYSDSDLAIDGTEFVANVSRDGNGGAAWTPQSATVANASVLFNVVLKGGNSGGIDTGTDLTISDSTLTDNETMTGSGGGTGTGGNATITNVHYARNWAYNLGGGSFVIGAAHVSGSGYEDNVASTNWGGGVFSNQSATVADTTFVGNASAYAGGALAVQVGSLELTGGRFERNRALAGGWGGAIYCGGPGISVTGTDFVENQCDAYGGGIAANDTTITGARFLRNHGGTGGGVWQTGDGTIDDALFADNQADSANGEGLALSGSVSVRHTTIAATAARPGSAVYVGGGTVTLSNDVITAHGSGIAANAGTVAADHVLFHANGTDVQGAGATSTNAVTGDPLFVDPASDDYHLGLGSAAIDAGPDAGVETDIDGDARPLGAGYDLGYDEAVPPPTTTTTTTTTTTLPAEVCDNCLDDDGNGLTDLEDPACCTSPGAMTVGRIRIATGKKGATLALAATAAQAGIASGNASTQDVVLQLRQADREVLCARIPAASLSRRKSTLRFTDRKHAVATAAGLEALVLRAKADGSGVLKAHGRGGSLAAAAAGPARVTVGLRAAGAAACSSAQVDLRAKGRSGLVAP